MEKDFIIGQVSWLTQVKRNYEFDNNLCYLAFKNIINYLQVNGLTTRTILADDAVNEETSLKLSDLTNEGFMLVKKCFDKWIGKVIDKAIEPTNYKMLDNELKKIKTIS
jgi:hypothetical protein